MRKNWARRSSFALGVSWAAVAVTPAGAGGPALTWLGALNTPYAEAHGVSESGAVAGWAGTANPHLAFRWENGTMQNLPSLGGSEGSEAWGLSDDGQVVVGYSFLSGGVFHAVVWQSGTLIDLGTLGGSTSQAYDASADGSVVVGAAIWSGDGRNRAFRWTQAGGMQNLGTLPGGIRSVARGVSSDGNVVAGWSGFENLNHHAFRWENGVMADLHNPDWPTTWNSEAQGISGDGAVVVGVWAGSSWSPVRPFRWSASTGMVDLGVLPGGAWGEAWAANFDGSKVVGWSEVSSGNWHALLWEEELGLQDLNVLFADLLTDGSILRTAYAISANGRYIAGYGQRPGGAYEAYVLDTTGGIPGDLDGDGDVDLADLAALLGSFGLCVGDAGYNPAADLDGDNCVTLADLSVLLGNFGL